jgi:hypothetical protein
MAEILAVVQAISPIVKGIATAYKFINDIANAEREAKDVTNQLRATKAVLVALKTTLDTQHQSEACLRIWSVPARTTLRSIKITVARMNSKLGSSGAVQFTFLEETKVAV